MTTATRRKIYEQFDMIASLVPNQPEYCYLNMVRDNRWAGLLSLSAARRVLAEWRESRKNLKRCKDCEHMIARNGRHRCSVGLTPL